MHDLIKYPAKRQTLEKFAWVLLIVLVYAFVMVSRFGENGLLITALTWSAFVLGTPIADAGLLLDLPLRLITKIRMVYAELIVWLIAITLNILTLSFNPQIYQQTTITAILRKILTTPFPLWLIVVLSAGGTFLSIAFADELLDIKFHNEIKIAHRYGWLVRTIGYVIFFALLYVVYHHFLSYFGIAL